MHSAVLSVVCLGYKPRSFVPLQRIWFLEVDKPRGNQKKLDNTIWVRLKIWGSLKWWGVFVWSPFKTRPKKRTLRTTRQYHTSKP